MCGVLKSDNYNIIITDVRVVHGTIKSLTKQNPGWKERERERREVLKGGEGCLIFTLCGVLKSDNYNIIITDVRVVHGTIKSLTNKERTQTR